MLRRLIAAISGFVGLTLIAAGFVGNHLAWQWMAHSHSATFALIWGLTCFALFVLTYT